MQLTYHPADGGAPLVLDVHDFKGPGVAMGMHNTQASIEGFARASFNYGLARKYPVYLSTKNTILKAYDGMFKDVFQEIFDAEFKAQFEAAGLTYEHRLIDDMVAERAEMERRLCLGLQELRRRRGEPTSSPRASAASA